MIFIVFSVIGLVLRLKFLKAIRNGLMIAVGFGGVYIVVDYFLGHVAPAAQATGGKNSAASSPYTDVGWAANAAFAWGSPWAYLIVIIMIGVNLVMIATKMTDT